MLEDSSHSSDSATAGGNYISEPWMSPKGGGSSSNPAPPLPYPLFMKNQKSLFGDIFGGGGFFGSSGPSSQGGGPVSGQGSSEPGPSTMDSISGQHRGFGILGGGAGG